MATYSIDAFWKPRLANATAVSGPFIRGWNPVRDGLATFHEAPLSLSKQFGEPPAPASAPLILVSAPGAVGKSTLAKQIAFHTRSVYVDLATAGPVGESTLSGGLLQCKLVEGWLNNTVALLIDGLDEARLRVTQEAFEAFLRDVARLSTGRTLPTILFGRTGAISDAWLVMDGENLSTPVFEIGFYDHQAAVNFTKTRLRHASETTAHLDVQFRAVELLLSRLRQETESDGDRFAGYAPVLLAVADRVVKERNAGALVAAIESGHQAVTLQSVVNAILNREHQKLESLQFEDETLANRLYSPGEQLDWLVAHTYGTAAPAQPAQTSNEDGRRYERALKAWVPEHPFLGGGGGDSPSSVFDAAISAHALSKPGSAEAALRRELGRGAAANPFLSVFYPRQPEHAGVVALPVEHIGIVYASVRSRLALGETATLTVMESGRGDGR